jgi:hypothetical protein
MTLESWPTGVRLKARLFTAGSGPFGIEVVTIKLEKTEALLVMPAPGLAALPADARESFTLDVELPRLHPFGRRCIHCRATFTSVSQADDGMVKVVIAIHRMQFIPMPQGTTPAISSGFSSGGERIQ